MPNNASVTIYGKVNFDPTNRQTSNNTTMLTLKCSVQTTKKSENPQYPYESDLYDVVIYGNYAEKLIPTVKRGCSIMAVGDLQMGKPWKDREGNTHITPQVLANKVVVTSGGNWNNNGNNNRQAPAAPAAPAAVESTEEVPF